MKRWPIKRSLAALGLLAGLLAPFFLSTFAMTIAITALAFAIFAVSLNLILGHGGLPSLGHAAFFGTGAYAVAFMVQGGFRDFIVLTTGAIAFSALFGLLLGPVLLRTRGTYFLMATLAVGEVMRNIAISWRTVTGGDDGLYGIKLPVVFGIDLANSRTFYFFLLAALVLVLVLMRALTRSPFGHTLRAVRDNRSRVAILGIAPFTIELTAFVFSAAIAGFAGAMFAFAKGFVSPGVLSVETSAHVLLMVVLGGPATLVGPVAGAIIVEAVRGIGSTYTDRWLTVLGLLAVLVALDPRRVMQQPWLRRFARTLAIAPPREPESAPPAARSKPRPQPVVQRPAHADRLLMAKDIAKRFGGLSVLNGISLHLAPGERRGLIGPNGAGKTTFLNILSGLERPNSGSVWYGDRDVTALPAFDRAQLGIGRTFQIISLFNDSTVRENIMLALVAREGYGLRLMRDLERYGALQTEADRLLDDWGLRHQENLPVKLLSYGQRRLIEIVLSLATRPQVLLLDEPAAGLSGAETKLIIQAISALDAQLSILIVEHDMDLVFAVCDRVTVIADGKVLAEGTGDQVRGDKAVVEAYLGMPL
jgi:ABC-type branched-subunit amino acid transport system ATPase component/ABC-type branched-subunit amino acid transport system permease subunit